MSRHSAGVLTVTMSVLLVAQFHFYGSFGKYVKHYIEREEEARHAQMMMMMTMNNNSNSRADVFAAFRTLSIEDKRVLLHEFSEDVLQNGMNPRGEIPYTSPYPTNEYVTDKSRRDNDDSPTDLISALESLPAEEREDIINAANGQEYQYRLTCPNHEDTADILKAATENASRSVIIGYHVGMLHNWRKIVKDQLNTLFQCGLGAVADHMFISYSNNSTMEEELQELKSILNKYNFARDATILYSDIQPIEGVAINSLHDECTLRVESMDSPNSDTVAFYFHTKGSSMYDPEWETKSFDEMYSYSHVLYWRKYMEYFTIERPYLCMKQIFEDGKFGCGVEFHDWDVNAHYSGNFWAASCRHLSSLDPLLYYPLDALDAEERRHDAEFFIANQTNTEHFVSLSELNKNLYEELVPPSLFSEYSKFGLNPQRAP